MGLPIFGESNYSNPQWVNEPNNRGTYGLLQTCILTLGLCVYSAIHLNVFHKECGWWMRAFICTKWIIVALLAPEFVVLNAWSQRRQAVRIAQLLRRRAGQDEPRSWISILSIHLSSKLENLTEKEVDPEAGQVKEDDELGTEGNNVAPSDAQTLQAPVTTLPATVPEDIEPPKNGAVTVADEAAEEKPPSGNNQFAKPAAIRKPLLQTVSAQQFVSSEERFDLTHGFLIVMGGIVLDMSHDDKRVWPPGCDSLTLTPACFEDLFETSEFQEIDLSFLTREQIEGRQSVDTLAKALVVVQALWFCCQFIARLDQRLPVSLLELNTFAHALCALFIYVLWWHKPKDVGTPFVMRTERSEALRNLCASQWTSGAAGKYYEGQQLSTAADLEEQQDIDNWRPMLVHGGAAYDVLMKVFRGRRNITLSPGCGEDWHIFDYSNRWFYFPHLPLVPRYRIRVCGATSTEVLQYINTNDPIPDTPGYRLAPVFESLQVDDTTLERWRRSFLQHHMTSNYAVWLRDRQPNFAWPRGLDDSEDGPRIAEELLVSMMMLLLTGLGYGGLHMLAWNSGALKKTGAAQVFWKLSCLLLMGTVPFAFCVWFGLKKWKGGDAHLKLHPVLQVVFGVALFLTLLAYFMSRVYLLVEIVFVIPFMDLGVYQEPQFSAYWAHFG